MHARCRIEWESSGIHAYGHPIDDPAGQSVVSSSPPTGAAAQPVRCLRGELSCEDRERAARPARRRARPRERGQGARRLLSSRAGGRVRARDAVGHRRRAGRRRGRPRRRAGAGLRRPGAVHGWVGVRTAIRCWPSWPPGRPWCSAPEPSPRTSPPVRAGARHGILRRRGERRPCPSLSAAEQQNRGRTHALDGDPRCGGWRPKACGSAMPPCSTRCAR